MKNATLIIGVLLVGVVLFGCASTSKGADFPFVEVTSGQFYEIKSNCGWCSIHREVNPSSLSADEMYLAMNDKCAGKQSMIIRLNSSDSYDICLASSETLGKTMGSCGTIEEGKYYREKYENTSAISTFFSFGNNTIDYFNVDIRCLEDNGLK